MHAETSTGGSFGQNVDLFYKIVDLLNEIEDILVKSWLLKPAKQWTAFLTNLWTFCLERGFFSTYREPPWLRAFSYIPYKKWKMNKLKNIMKNCYMYQIYGA